MKKFTIREQQEQAEKIAEKSNHIWASVNTCIAVTLLNKGKRSREHIASSLEKLAGPKKKCEPFAVNNLRIAAKQIRSGIEISLL